MSLILNMACDGVLITPSKNNPLVLKFFIPPLLRLFFYSPLQLETKNMKIKREKKHNV